MSGLSSIDFDKIYREREEVFDSKVNNLAQKYGRIFFKNKAKDSKCSFIYEDDSYSLELSIHGNMYGQATRKDISFSEGMPYNRKTKRTHQLVRQSWRESDRLFRGDIANIVNFIMTIDEKGRTLGKVYKWNANRGFGFLSTFNCSRVFFHISDVPEKFR